MQRLSINLLEEKNQKGFQGRSLELGHENHSSPDEQCGRQIRSNFKLKELCVKSQTETTKATYAWKQAALYRIPKCKHGE